MHVIGLDVSLRKTGFVILSYDEETAEVRLLHRECIETDAESFDDMRAVLHVTNTVLHKLVDSKFDPADTHVVIEDYAMGSRMGKSFTRSEIVGAIKYHVSAHFGFPIYLVAPTSLKKYMGKGNFSKDDMRMAAVSTFGFFDDNDNIVDAYCICRYLIDNRTGKRLTLIMHRPYPAMRFLQVPANNPRFKVLPRPLTKKLQPRNLNIAQPETAS